MAGLSGFVLAILILVAVGGGFAGIEMVRAGPMYLVPAIAVWLVALLALMGVGLIAAILAPKDVRVVTMMSAVLTPPPPRQPPPPVPPPPPHREA